MKISKYVGDAFLLSFGSVWLLGVTMLLGLSFANNYDYIYIVSIGLCLLVVPYLYIEMTNKHLNQSLRKIMDGKLRVGIIVALSCSFISINSNFTGEELFLIQLKYFIVAISEELLYRYYIQVLFEKSFTPVMAMILQALLFSFVLHSGLPMLLNLLVRFPAGVVLTVIFKKTNNLSIVIGIHFLYDFVIHLLLS